MNFQNVTPKIDNKPPKVNIETIYNVRILEDEAKMAMQIDKQNMELMKNINIIHRSKGQIDNDESKDKRDYTIVNRDADNRKIYEQNLEMYNKIKHTVATYSFKALMEDWRKNKSMINKGMKHALSISKKPKKSSVSINQSQSLLKAPKFVSRPLCFFELEVAESNEKLGKIVVELYEDVVPQTCQNFLALCRGFNRLSYRNTPLHRIISGYMAQGGDVTKFNGAGGASIYEDDFNAENYELSHTGPGVLSMCRKSDKVNLYNSKFNLTFRSLKSMDGMAVVFGKIVRGLQNIYKIEALGTKSGKPRKRVIVSDCGVC